MLMPSIIGDSFLDDFFGYPERTYAAPKQTQMNGFMQADVARVRMHTQLR